ncbi:MAG TPA: DUF3147 family protein [Acidimicrobiales bacterium]|jgi:hypothetical protein|nr:DUF3147 family protein [Acidimicrobiales bacterium]
MATEALFGADLGELRKIKPTDVAMRFAFGAALSIVAGVSGAAFGAIVGGFLLAFPAILPAALTLVERQDGSRAAVHDVGGAVLGAVGLVSFAVVAAETFKRIPAWGALASALGAWALVSLTLYVLRATGVLPLPASIRGRRPLA